MSIDDIDMDMAEPSPCLDMREIPGSWEEERSFSAASETWLDHIVSDSPTQ